MAVLPILTYPDPRLRLPCETVTAFDDALAALVKDMGETMQAANGAGLAAPQVGAPLKLFIIDAEVAGRDPTAPPVVVANPEVVETSRDSQNGDEGCLSFPGIFSPVKRPLRVRVRAQDEKGQTFEIEGSELLARALLHEHDHLTGRLLIDNVGPVKREMIKRKMKKEAARAAAESESAG